MTNDWLIGSSRADTARRRLIEVAGRLIAERGIDRFDLAELAQRAHCSRATIYRHTGGKKQLIEAVFLITSTRITEQVRLAVADTAGPERARIAITVALNAIRSDAIARQFVGSRAVVEGARTVTQSPVLAAIAAELIGLDPDDTIGASMAVRSFLALVLWPPANNADEPFLIDAMVSGLRGAQQQTRQGR